MKDQDALHGHLGSILVFLVCFCVSFRPIGSGMTFGLGSNLIIHIVIFFCGILWAVRAALCGRITYRCGKIAAAAAVFILMCAIWTVIAPRKLPALITLISWTSDIILLLVVIQTTDNGFRRTVLTCLMASAVVAACIGIAQHFWGLEELRRIIAADPERVRLQMGLTEDMWGAFMGRVNTDRIFGTFVYPNALAGFLDVVLPVALGMCLAIALGLRRPELPEGFLMSGFLSSVTLVAVFSACLLLTFSKGGWAAALAAGFFFFVSASGASRRRVLVTACICAGVVLLLLAVGELGARDSLMPKIAQYVSSFRVRLEYWEAGLRMMRDNYFVGGAGLRSFGDFYPAYKKPSYQEVKLAHSTAVQLLADMGIFGLASYAMLWIFLLKGLRIGTVTSGASFSKTSPLEKGDLGGFAESTPDKSPPAPLWERGGTKQASFRTVTYFSRRWIGIAGGLTAFALLALVARDISPFTKQMGQTDYAEWFRYTVLWVVSFLVIERLARPERPMVRAGLAAGCVGYLVHGMVDFDMFVPGVHQAALLAAACGCGLPARERPLGNPAKALLLGGSLITVGFMMLLLRGLLPLPDLLAGEILKAEGRRSMRDGRLDEAVMSLSKAADANPADDEIHSILSTIYLHIWKTGRKAFHGKDTRTLALASAKSAVRTNPRSSSHRALLARLLAASDVQKAIGHARKAVALYPARPQGHILLADLLVRTGRNVEAAKEYREALRLNELVMESWLRIPGPVAERISKFIHNR